MAGAHEGESNQVSSFKLPLAFSVNFPLAKASHIAKPKGRDVHSARCEGMITSVT